MAAQREFSIGEHVTCIFVDKPYNAKIIDIKKDKDGNDCYCIHFTGWNTRYDEKIPIGQEKERMFKGSAEAYAKEHGIELPVSTKGKKNAMPATADSTVSNDTPGTSRAKPGKKSSLAPVMKVEELKVELPKPLRKILIDDYDLVGRHFINRVPCDVSVDKIITDYIKTIPVTNEQMRTIDDLLIEYDDSDVKITNLALICTARGLVDYFNVVLGYQLLYKFERPQYNDLVQKRAADKGLDYGNIANLPDHGFRSSEEYGLVHLLRMIAKLPDLLKLTQWNDHLINRIMVGVHDLLVFLNKNHKNYYKGSGEYTIASNEYYRRALTIDEAAGTSQ